MQRHTGTIERIGAFFMNPETESESATSTPEPLINRRSVLLEEIRGLDIELSDHDAVMAVFRRKNTATVNGAPVFLYPQSGDPGAERAQIEGEWRKLVKGYEAIQRQRNVVLAELAHYS